MRPIYDEKGAVVQIQATSRDVSEKMAMQEKLRYDALHDSLSELPNRNFLIQHLTQQLETLDSQPSSYFAVLFLDLDRFKIINDSLGHSFGDKVLIEIAARLKNDLPKTSFIARLGGDEFVIVVRDVENVDRVTNIASNLLTKLKAPFFIENRNIAVSASIGIVIADSPQTSADNLLRNADIAMYQAKANGRSCYKIFNHQMHTNVLKQLQIEHDLRKALDHEEFFLVYQPIVTLPEANLLGFESLVRWRHPKLGMISPDRFIHIAEETGLILPLGAWILRTACHQLADWRRKFPSSQKIKVSVNLSVKQLQQAQVLNEIDTILAETKLSGDSVTLEITESVLLDANDEIYERLDAIKQRGIQISIDDFGTGYSSLSYLHRLPIDVLKIDRSFVQSIDDNLRNLKITRSIITLAHQLDIATVAEGIETGNNLAELNRLGCEYGQGYFFAKPLAVEDALSWLS
jgi:diguanylate cyclase (GGDEF)-like protein